ncbi:MAG: DUF433 domain-containing protein [Nitrospirae bacterium]|nr:DUF433 domain-containing protein [Nitrospirota bacterium]MCL5977181.1 DUF433 domain-containing protein [Nitrospirota bacterium]
MSTLVKQFKHPYITIDRKIRGGEPIIAGTGIRVLDIAVRYEIMGMSPEDIIIALPHLTLSQIHDALSYYYEHKEEIDRVWKKTVESASIMRKAHKSVLEQKIGSLC